MPEEKCTTYVFGEFTVDPRRRVVLRKGETVQLSSRAFDLLLALVESEGRELGKDELMNRIWPDQIVEDANLTVTMANLRKALGEKAGDHRFVVTIPGRGYRFVGQLQSGAPLIVQEHHRGQIVIEDVDVPATTAAHVSSRWWPAAVGAIALVAIV